MSITQNRREKLSNIKFLLLSYIQQTILRIKNLKPSLYGPCFFFSRLFSRNFGLADREKNFSTMENVNKEEKACVMGVGSGFLHHVRLLFRICQFIFFLFRAFRIDKFFIFCVLLVRFVFFLCRWQKEIARIGGKEGK